MNKRTDGTLVSQQDPAFDAFSITPSDGVNLAQTARALYVGVAGDVRVMTPGGATVTFKNVSAGILPVSAVRVFATATTATQIIGLV